MSLRCPLVKSMSRTSRSRASLSCTGSKNINPQPSRFISRQKSCILTSSSNSRETSKRLIPSLSAQSMRLRAIVERTGIELEQKEKHPLDALDAEEISGVITAVKASVGEEMRINHVTLREPNKDSMISWLASSANGSIAMPQREADVRVMTTESCKVYDLVVGIGRDYECSNGTSTYQVKSTTQLPNGINPLLTPDDCDLAEELIRADASVREALVARFGSEIDPSKLICDPWSVHLASDSHPALDAHASLNSGMTPRLVQTFLYMRKDSDDDNQYAHPIDILPTVCLNSKRVLHIFIPEDKGESTKAVSNKIPMESVNYHRDMLHTNDFLGMKTFREDVVKPLDVIQPEGPSFVVDGNEVSWQKWKLRVGFNHREGLVLHNVEYDGRPVMWRASLVEMAVPYGDPQEPFQGKCAFDVGDYGLGYCTNSLKLGCDCLGSIHYFDATLANSAGEPYTVPQAICMHEEDVGLLWKHVEFRSGHSEARRSRRLVISNIVTVVNYEYLMYWYFLQDGTIEFEMKLSGELSTNMLSPAERANGGIPDYGTLVAPGVNAQIHQHMFCFRLDMAVDGHNNSVEECDVVVDDGPNPYGNMFRAKKTLLESEQDAQRDANVASARTWNITNSTLGTAYKLIPYTRGPAQPPLLTSDSSAVTKRGKFAKKVLWVTPYDEDEKYPAGDCTVQSKGGEGLPKWTEQNRPVTDTDVVLWHSFGVVHVPRPEDFPVMPCEYTGFTLKPDGFFKGNPAIDLPPKTSSSSCCSNN